MKEPYVQFKGRSTDKPVSSIPLPDKKEPVRLDLQGQIGNAAVENLHQPLENGMQTQTPAGLYYQSLYGNSAMTMAARDGLFGDASQDAFPFLDLFNFDFLFDDGRLFPEAPVEAVPPAREPDADEEKKEAAKPKPDEKEGESKPSEPAVDKKNVPDLKTAPTTEDAEETAPKTVDQKKGVGEKSAKETARTAQEDLGQVVERKEIQIVDPASLSAPELAEWQAKVAKKTSAISADVPKGSGVKNVRASGAAAAARAAEERRKQQQGAGNILPNPPVIPDPLLPPTHDPVPAATALVRNASDKKLPDQKMPQLIKTKGNVMPQPPRMGLAAELGTKEVTTYGKEIETLDAQEKAATESKNKKELKRIKKARQALEKKFKAEWAEGKAEPLTLAEGPPQPPAAPMTEQTQADIGKVLAALSLMQDTAAKELVDEARRTTYREPVLYEGDFDEDFGKEGMAIAGPYFSRMIGEIGSAAHLKKEDIESHIKDRKKALEEKTEVLHGGLTDAAEFEKKKVEDLRQKQANEADAIHKGLEVELGRKADEFKTDVKPDAVIEKRAQLIIAVSRKEGQQTGAYERAGERRDKALSQVQSAYLETYRNAVQTERTNYFKAAWKERKNKSKEKAAAEAEAETQLAPTVSWLKDELVPYLDHAFRRLKKEAADTVTGFVTNLKSSAKAAVVVIGIWADRLMGDLGDFWAHIKRRKEDWRLQAKESAKAWEAERAGAARDALVQDINAIRMQTMEEENQLKREKAAGTKKLDEQKQKVQKASLETPPGPKDSILTIAVQMKDRLSAEERPKLSERFEEKVSELGPDKWYLVDIVAQAVEPGGMSAEKIGKKIRHATDRIGTLEDVIYEALANMGPLHAQALKLFYRDTYDADVESVLKSELSGAEEDRALGLLNRDPGKAGAATIAYAINPAFPGGGNPSAVMEVLRTTTNPADLRAKFKAEYDFDLDEWLKKSLKGDDLKRAQALLTGDKTTRYVTDLKHAVRSEDRKGLEAVYAQIRADVEQDAAKVTDDVRSGKADLKTKEWNAQRIEEEVKKRAAEVEKAYDKDAIMSGGLLGNTLRNDIDKNLKGAERDLALALHESNPTLANAARLKLEDKGGKLKRTFWGNYELTKGDSKAINNLIAANGERVKRDIERDEDIDLWNRRMTNAREQQVAYLRGWSPEQIQALPKWKEEEERKKSAETVKTKTEQHKDDFKETFEAAYGSIDVMLNRNLDGDSREKSRRLVEQGGLLKPEQKLHYAVVEKDADTVKSFLGSTSETEMNDIKAKWKASPEGKKWLEANKEEDDVDKGFKKFALSKFEGDNAFDIELDITGRSDDPAKMLERKEKKLHRQKTQYLLASGDAYEGMSSMIAGTPPGMGEKDYELRRLEREVGRLRGHVSRLKTLEKGSPEYNRVFKSYERQLDYVDSSAEAHREAVDRRTDDAAMIVGIIVTAIVIVATGGAATPLLAALAAGAGAAASIITKALMKGGAYIGTKEMWTDIVVGVVDTIVSAATAGLGGKLLKGIRPLAQMSKSAKLAPRLIAHGLAEGAENFVSTIPTSVAQQLMQKGELSFSETFTGAAIGAGLGGTLGSIGGFKKAGGAIADSADLLAHRGKPEQRLADWKLFEKAHPEKTYKDFLAELDSGILSKQAREQAEREAQRKMRRELFEHIPPAQRGQFKDVPIKRMSDAEFEQFTRSVKGQAVVLIKDGKPMVIIRESADLKSLREEGIHLLQSVDPKKAHLFKQLDEKVLSKWDNLGLDEQLSLYGKKLDIELDGQQRLIKNLEASLAAAGNDPVARKRILAQMDDAKHTLDNLSKRFDEVADITPQKRLDITSGKAPKPDYLDQPARLFSKKADDTLEVKKDVIDHLKKSGVNVDEDAGVLATLQRRAADGKDPSGTFKTVTDQLKALPPPDAAAYMKKITQLINSRDMPTGELAGFITAATKSTKPLEVLDLAHKLATKGNAADVIERPIMKQIASAVEKMEPDAAHKYLASMNELLDSYRRPPKDLSDFLNAASMQKDPAGLVRQMKSVVETIDKSGTKLSDDTLRLVSRTMVEHPGQAATYLDSLERLVKNHTGDMSMLDGFVKGSRRVDESGKLLDGDYIESVIKMNKARADGLITNEAFAVLAKKAASEGSPIDPSWLFNTKLFREMQNGSERAKYLFNFMALDDKINWNLFMRAARLSKGALDKAERKILNRARSRLRGVAGEIVFAETDSKVLQQFGITDVGARQTKVRQVDLTTQHAGPPPKATGTDPDFLATGTDDLLHGVEIKSYNKSYWRKNNKAYDAWKTNYDDLVKKSKAAGQAIDEDQLTKQAKEMLDSHTLLDYENMEHLFKQLNEAKKGLPGPPFLVVSDTVKTMKKWPELEAKILKHAPDTKIVMISESDLQKVLKELQDFLDVP